MEKYRIKIESEKSGKKWYTAQAKCDFWSWESGKLWSSIDEYGNVGRYGGATQHDNIESTEKAIGMRRRYLHKLETQVIIDIEYKTI